MKRGGQLKRTAFKRTPPKWQAEGAAPLKRSKPMRRTAISTRGNAKTRAGQVRLDAAKAEVRGRSEGWCEVATPACPDERHRGVHVHHVLPRSAGGQHDADNLLNVCAPAHEWIHGNPSASYEQGWLRRRGAVA
jgi:hypothetical protein